MILERILILEFAIKEREINFPCPLCSFSVYNIGPGLVCLDTHLTESAGGALKR